MCNQNGCDGKRLARGLCSKHYARARRSGVFPDIGIRFESVEEAFSGRTSREGECLIWTGSKDGSGYGKLRRSGKDIKVHRYAWERENGPIPDGMVIDHKCWNRACVEVEHLRLATRSENSAYTNGAYSTNASTGIRNVSRIGDGFRVKVGRKVFGTFPTVEEASVVADNARKEMYGEFAGNGYRREDV